MYDTDTYTKQFDMNEKDDKEHYSSIINNPLCHIIKEIKEKLVEKLMNDEGEPSYIKERIVLVVTWQEKKLLEDF